MKKWFIALLLIAPHIYADLYVSNTAEWTDVYSTGLYASLTGNDFLFLTSPKHSESITDEIQKSTPITVVETSKIPFVRNYAGRLQKLGYTSNNITTQETSTNLLFADKSGVTSFIIIDPTYGYDAISIAPYAVMTQSYVIFATSQNLQNITNFLDSRRIDSLIIYGDVDTDVKNQLARFRPDIIDAGNHYQNNLAIARQLQTMGATEQAILSNGEFLEHNIFTAGTVKQPVIYIGRNKPPEETINYLNGAPYKTHIVVGNDLINSAQLIKKTINKPLFIKFGKGLTGDTTYKPVGGLDIFKVPVIDLLLQLRGLTYNTDTGILELSIENAKNARTYLQPSVLVRGDGKPIETVGEDNVGKLDRQQTHTYTYPAQLYQYLETNLSAQVFIPYGAYDNTLDFAITLDVPINVISNLEQCALDITDATYDSETQRIHIGVKTDKTCNSQLTIQDIMVNGKQRNIQSDENTINGNGGIDIKVTLDQIDLADNKEITIKAAFGTRPGALTQFTSQTLPLKSTNQLPWMPIITILMAIITITTLLWRKKKR